MAVQAKMPEAATLKRLFGMIGATTEHANIQFGRDGMRLFAMDGARVACVCLRLDATTWLEYRCPNPITIGVRVASVMKVLTLGANDDVVCIHASEDSDKLFFGFESPDGMRSTKFAMYTLDLTLDDYDLNLEYISTLEMPSVDFASLCRNLNIIGPKVAITVNTEKVVFHASGNGDTSASIAVSRGQNITIETADLVELSVAARYLVLASKEKSLTDTVCISASEETPLRVRYSLDEESYVEFYIAPSIADQ